MSINRVILRKISQKVVTLITTITLLAGMVATLVIVPVPASASTNQPVLVAGTDWLSDVSCPSTTLCWAVGQNGEYTQSTTPTGAVSEWTASGGWGTGLPISGSSQLNSISCPSTTLCLAVGNYYSPSGGGNSEGVVVKWTASAGWGNAQPITNSWYLSGVSCPSTTLCWAVGDYYSPSGEQDSIVVKWTASVGWGTLQPLVISSTIASQLRGVSCASSSLCWAVGGTTYSGCCNAIAFEWNGNSWGNAISVPNMSRLGDISCPSISLCWATGRFQTLKENEVVEWTSTNGWGQAIPISGMTYFIAGISCLSNSLCWATGGLTVPGSVEDGLITWNGSSWSNTVSVPNTDGSFGISCPSTSLCWIVGHPGAQDEGIAYDPFPAPSITPVAPPPAPIVTDISPTSGQSAGGTVVTITGSNLFDAAYVFFGSTAASSFSIDGDTKIVATAPPGTGTVNVEVTTPGGTSVAASNDRFTYITPLTVTGISTTAGRIAGGTPVTITGTGFVQGTVVMFGNVTATAVTINSSTSITATAPPGTGTVNITVTTPLGSSVTASTARFTYLPPPTVDSISSSIGSVSGGTPVTIAGTGFVQGAVVMFGNVTATAVTINSSTSITAVAPPGTGTVNITVTTPGGTSNVTPASQFGYSTWVPISPVRICDTRPNNPSDLSGNVLSQCEGQTLGGARQSITIQVAGIGDIPNNVSAVFANITASRPTANGELLACPAGSSTGCTSVSSFRGGTYALAFAKTFALNNGEMTIEYRGAGFVNVIVDVEGYLSPGAGIAMASHKATSVFVGHVTSSPSSITVPGVGTSSNEAVELDISVSGASANGYISIYPANISQPPTTSAINFVGGNTVIANEILVSAGKLHIYANTGNPLVTITLIGTA